MKNLDFINNCHDIGVDPRRINEIVHGKRSITADTTVRLAKYFNMSESFWMGLQSDYDVEKAHRLLGKKQATDPFRNDESQNSCAKR